MAARMSLGGLGGAGGGPAPPNRPTGTESSGGKEMGRLGRLWYILKMLYKNDFTRGLGRDILFFAGSVLVIRVMMAGLAEDDAAAGMGPPPIGPPRPL